MINITDKRARVLWQQEMDRQMQALERPYIRKLTPLLNKQFRDAAEYVMHGMLDSTDFAIDKRQKEHLALLKEHYKRVATVFGKKSYKIIESGKFVFPPELKAPVDEYWKEINRWSETEAATKIRRIQKTTKGKIASIIKTGMGEQESHRDIAKRITKTSYSINPFRAQTIALTETHTASVRAVDTAVKSTRIEMEREWVSAHDMRTRTRGKGNIFEHLKAFPNGPDGERTSQDGKFTGTGEALSYPGDSSGSPGNVIRCRCCLLYHSVRRTEPIKPYEPQESFIPAQNLDEAQNRFEKIGIEYVSAPGRGQYKWTDEKLFLENILNPSLQELERLEREFPSFARLRDNPISNIEFYRGMKLSTGGWGQYTKEFKEIRLAMVDTAKEMKDSLLIGEKNFNISLNFRSILRHETGHHFQDIVLTNTERDSFLQLWESKGRIKQGVFSEDKASRWFKKNISGYAGTNQQEAFAECFSAYTSPKYKAGMLPKEIEEYFEKLIGKRKLPGVVVKPVREVFGKISIGKPVKSAEEILEHYKASSKVTFIEGKSSAELKQGIEERLGRKMWSLRDKKTDEFMDSMLGFKREEEMSSIHYEMATKNLIRQWARTSGDTNPRSIMMQLAAKAEFKLEEVSLWWEDKVLEQAKKLFKTHEKAARQFLREMYKDTQEHLAKQGLKTVRVARGYVGDIGIDVSTPEKLMEKVKIELQPISSFSSDIDTAISFTKNGKSGEPVGLFFADIPVDRILSTPITGYGCMSEFEFVVLGSRKQTEQALISVAKRTNENPYPYSALFGTLTEGKVVKIMKTIFEATK